MNEPCCCKLTQVLAAALGVGLVGRQVTTRVLAGSAYSRDPGRIRFIAATGGEYLTVAKTGLFTATSIETRY